MGQILEVMNRAFGGNNTSTPLPTISVPRVQNMPTPQMPTGLLAELAKTSPLLNPQQTRQMPLFGQSTPADLTANVIPMTNFLPKQDEEELKKAKK